MVNIFIILNYEFKIIILNYNFKLSILLIHKSIFNNKLNI